MINCKLFKEVYFANPIQKHILIMYNLKGFPANDHNEKDNDEIMQTAICQHMTWTYYLFFL